MNSRWMLLPMLALLLSPMAGAFEPTHRRYLSAHDIFRIFTQKFPAGTKWSGICAKIIDLNADAYLGVVKAVNGEAVIKKPSPAFVKWYSGCLKRLIRDEIQPAFYPAGSVTFDDIQARLSRPEIVRFLGEPAIEQMRRDREADERRWRQESINARYGEVLVKDLETVTAYFAAGLVRPFPLPAKYERWKALRDFLTARPELRRDVTILDRILNHKSLSGLPSPLDPKKDREWARLAGNLKALRERIDAEATPNILVSTGYDLWNRISPAARGLIVQNLIAEFIGPDVLENEDEVVKRLLVLVEPRPAPQIEAYIRLPEVIEKLVFHICSLDEFLSY